MFFATYIQLLHKHVDPCTSRGEFTEKIIKLIVTNEKLVNYSVSSYNGFYDGKTDGTGKDKKVVGDKIKHCACKINNYLNTFKYVEYLKTLCFNIDAKNGLCESFKCEVPDINIDNYADKLAKLLIQIIKNAANEKNLMEANDTVSDTTDSNNTYAKTESIFIATTKFYDNHVEDNSVNITNINNDNTKETIVFSSTNRTHIEDNRQNTTVINMAPNNDSDLAALKGLINELNSNFLSLDEKGRILHLSSWTRSEKQQNEKEQEFRILQDIFIEENNKLRQYYLTFPELNEIFDKMILLSETLTFRYDFRNDGDNHTFIKCDDRIEEYRKCIKEVWKALTYLL